VADRTPLVVLIGRSAAGRTLDRSPRGHPSMLARVDGDLCIVADGGGTLLLVTINLRTVGPVQRSQQACDADVDLFHPCRELGHCVF